MKKPAYMLASTLIVLALAATQSLAQSTYEPYSFTTLAGNASYGSDGTGSAARFRLPSGVAVDSAGNVYVADTDNHTIRKIAPTGVVTTLAGREGASGSADGTANTARFNQPSGVTVDSAGNIYVADTGNYTIRKVAPGGVVTTLAGLAGSYGSANGTGSAARFGSIYYPHDGPSGVAVDSAGNVYVADRGNTTIRKVTPAGVVTTLAGLAGSGGSADGTGSDARFGSCCLGGSAGPTGVAVDSADNLYVADTYNNTIRKVTPAGVVTTLAGLGAQIDNDGNLVRVDSGYADGTGSTARFNQPSGVAVDSAGNVYVADIGNNTIRKVTPAGVVTTLAGLPQFDGYGNPVVASADGTGSTARFNQPSDVAVDSAGNVYVADTGNFTIRKVTPEGVVTALAGLAGSAVSADNADGTGSAARFYNPWGVAVDSAGNLYVANESNHTIRKVTPAGVVTTLAGQAQCCDVDGNLVGGSADGMASAARFNWPIGVAVDSAGNVYVADDGNSTIRKVTPAGMVTTLAGLAGSFGSADGTGSEARFRSPTGVAVDSAGNVYVADSGNSTIRKVTPAGMVTTLAGLAQFDTNGNPCCRGSADGTGSAARFSDPFGVAVDSAGNLYVTDESNQTIRKVTPAGVVTTLAGLAGSFGSADGTGSAARFYYPLGVAVDSLGNVYVTDAGNSTIRKVTPAGAVTTLAGLAGSSGSADGTGNVARFYGPGGPAVDSAGNVYVADYGTGNGTIRKGSPAPRILKSGPGFGFNGGEFDFNLTGPAGRLVVVEASTDLVSWQPLWTNTFTFPAALNFSDPESGVYPNRFYRGHLP